MTISFAMAWLFLLLLGLASVRGAPQSSNCTEFLDVVNCMSGGYISYSYDTWLPNLKFTGQMSKAGCACYCLSTEEHVLPANAMQAPCEQPSYLYGTITGWLSQANVTVILTSLTLVIALLQLFLTIGQYGWFKRLAGNVSDKVKEKLRVPLIKSRLRSL